jgi:hypothetical protein
MGRPIASIVLMVTISVWSLPGAPQDHGQANRTQQKKAPSKSKTASDSLTGCVDEQDGRYVLLSDRTRDPLANLEADGFETEGFAKHVGHKVTVRGTSNSDGARPIFRVRSIETLSETCEP